MKQRESRPSSKVAPAEWRFWGNQPQNFPVCWWWPVAGTAPGYIQPNKKSQYKWKWN